MRWRVTYRRDNGELRVEEHAGLAENFAWALALANELSDETLLTVERQFPDALWRQQVEGNN